MNILLWAPHGAGEHYWGPGISAYRLYKTGLPKNVKLYLAHGSKHQKLYPDVFENTYFVSGLSKGYFSNLIFLVRSYLWIKKNHRKFNVVHVLDGHEISFRPALWFESLGVPAFCKITGDRGGLVGHSKISQLLGIAKRRKAKLNNLSGYIAISDVIRENLLNAEVVEDKIFDIPNGVNEAVFKPVYDKEKANLRKKHNLKEKFTVLFVGGVSKRKQCLMLVKAFHQSLASTKNNMQLILLGPDRDGIELQNIMKYIEKNNLSDSIIYIPYSSIPHEYFQLSDVFCLPSKSEGMSNALLEAMSTGLPSIVTPISGSKDLVHDGYNGTLIKKETDLSNAIKFYYLNQKISVNHGNNARKLILKKYSSLVVLTKHIDLFRAHMTT